MATTYNNCQMGIVDASGNLSVIYPQTKASLVSCDSGNYGGSSAVTDVQSALNNLSTALGNYMPKKAKRVECRYTNVAAGADSPLSKAQIASTAGLSVDALIIILCDSVRPATTWNCIPIFFYNGNYCVHNAGSTQDDIIASFTIIHS